MTPAFKKLRVWFLQATSLVISILTLKFEIRGPVFFLYYFIYFWLCWVFVPAWGLSLVVVHGFLMWCMDAFSYCGAWAVGSWASVVVVRGL